MSDPIKALAEASAWNARHQERISDLEAEVKALVEGRSMNYVWVVGDGYCMEGGRVIAVLTYEPTLDECFDLMDPDFREDWDRENIAMKGDRPDSKCWVDAYRWLSVTRMELLTRDLPTMEDL